MTRVNSVWLAKFERMIGPWQKIYWADYSLFSIQIEIVGQRALWAPKKIQFGSDKRQPLPIHSYWSSSIYGLKPTTIVRFAGATGIITFVVCQEILLKSEIDALFALFDYVAIEIAIASIASIPHFEQKREKL